MFTHHHLLLDGWSLPLLLETVFEAYESRTATARPVSTAARDFAAWRAQRPRADVERFFRDTLAGFTTPTPLPPPRRRDATGCRVLIAGAPPATTERAGGLGVTASTVLQGAWALVLSEMSGERDVVFGVTSSGRNAPVAVSNVPTMPLATIRPASSINRS